MTARSPARITRLLQRLLVASWLGPLCLLTNSAGAAAPQSARSAALPSIVVLPVQLSGDTGGPQFAAEHAARLRLATAELREQLARSGLYRVLDDAPARGLIAHLESQQRYWYDCNGCDLDVGRALRADKVLVAWVDRVSGLILTLTYEIHDVATRQIDARKSFDFRGDTDTAWTHAIRYMVRDLREGASGKARGTG